MWDDPEVATVFRRALKHDASQRNRQQRSREPIKPQEIALSSRMTQSQRAKTAPYLLNPLIFLGNCHRISALPLGISHENSMYSLYTKGVKAAIGNNSACMEINSC